MRQLLALGILVGLVGSAGATLLDRDIDNDGTNDAFYDTASNTTWMAESLGWGPLFDWEIYRGELMNRNSAAWRLPSQLDFDTAPDSCWEEPAGCIRAVSEGSSEVSRLFAATGWALYGVWGNGQMVSNGSYLTPVLFGSGYDSFVYDTTTQGASFWALCDGDVGFGPRAQPLGEVPGIPEPTTWGLMLTGLLAGTALRRPSNRSRTSGRTACTGSQGTRDHIPA